VLVQAGTFTMGSPASESERGNDETQHQVTISRSFYLGKYPVTQLEYRKVLKTNPSEFKGGNLPVETVTWYDAVKYCNARSRKEGLSPAYTVNGETISWNRNASGYRLPTEAEWEYACRAGTTTRYYTGNSADAAFKAAAWYDENSRNKTHPVGEKSPNAWGICDMMGNVWEWCWDWYGDYASGAQTNPAGAASGSGRVFRGGSWYNSASICAVALRDYNYPYYRYFSIGFRVVCP
jgi:formylglycine-generating enzyme required for sulfatase activity